MSDFHIVVFFNDYYTLIIAFLTKQIQNRYRYRRLPDSLIQSGNVARMIYFRENSIGYEFSTSGDSHATRNKSETCSLLTGVTRLIC